jgi:hypothetical protein
VAENQLRLAVLNREVAMLEVAQAEALLRQRVLVSPIDGVVMERLLRVGEFRHDQSPVFTLAQVDPLRVEVFVPAALHGQVRAGMAAQVVPEDSPLQQTWCLQCPAPVITGMSVSGGLRVTATTMLIFSISTTTFWQHLPWTLLTRLRTFREWLVPVLELLHSTMVIAEIRT